EQEPGPWASQTDNREPDDRTHQANRQAALDPELAKTGGRQHQRARPGRLRRKPPEDDRPQRNAMHDIRLFGTYDPIGAHDAAQAVQRAEAFALALERDDAQPLRHEPVCMVTNARRYDDLETAVPSRPRHW